MCYLCLFAHSGVQHILTLQVTQRVYYKRQELYTVREHLGSPSISGEVRFAHLFSFVQCFVLFVFVMCLVGPMSPVSLNCPFLICPSVFSNVYSRYNSIFFLTSCVLMQIFVHFIQLLTFDEVDNPRNRYEVNGMCLEFMNHDIN